MPFDLATTQRTRSTFLPRRGSLVLDGAEGTIINVDSGCLWVTLENDPRDVVLVKGMRFEIDRSGRTVVVAEEDSRLRLTPAPTFVQKIIAALAQPSKKSATRSIDGLGKRATCGRAPYF
jgi:hypothetical protein